MIDLFFIQDIDVSKEQDFFISIIQPFQGVFQLLVPINRRLRTIDTNKEERTVGFVRCDFNAKKFLVFGFIG